MGDEQSTPAYADLLRTALLLGLQELECSIVQLPAQAEWRHAVVLATARTSSGLLFRAIGEACADGESGDDKRALVTLAESRAKRRVLSELACASPSHVDAENLGAQEASVSAEIRDAGEKAEGPARHGDEPLPPLFSSAVSLKDAAAHPCPVPPAEKGRAGSPEEPVGTAQAGQPSVGDPSEGNAARGESVEARHSSGGGAKHGGVNMEAAIGPDVLRRLMDLTRRKAEAEGAPIGEEEAMQRIDSYFQRAFGHPVAEGTQIEGQRVVQRLISGGVRSAGVRR